MKRLAWTAAATATLRRLALGLCLAAAAGSASAAPAVCPPPAAEDTPDLAALPAARDRGFLWRITRDGRSSYLYGTVHIARREWGLPGPRVVQAVGASDTVALELDLLDADILRRLAAGMQADPAERLPAALAARLQAQLEAACLPPSTMATLAPLVQLTVLTTLAGRWDGLDPAYAIDGFLAAYARALGKPVRSLETPELQLALLKGDPQTAQEDLERGLAQLEQGQVRPLLRRISEIWDQGREDELQRYEAWCDCAGSAAERGALKRLLDDRNPSLAAHIDALHAAGQRVFAAVGALHLIGPVGLPSLMAQRGFRVERVDLTR